MLSDGNGHVVVRLMNWALLRFPFLACLDEVLVTIVYTLTHRIAHPKGVQPSPNTRATMDGSGEIVNPSSVQRFTASAPEAFHWGTVIAAYRTNVAPVDIGRD